MAQFFRAIMALVFFGAAFFGGAQVSRAADYVGPALLNPADVLPVPVDGGPRVRHTVATQLGYIQPGYVATRFDYQYEAWLGQRWALTSFGRVSLAQVDNWAEDLSPWVEVGPQFMRHSTNAAEGGGTFTQALRAGVYMNGFPPEVSPAITYQMMAMARDPDQLAVAEFGGLVSLRPLGHDGFVYTEGNTALWWHPVGIGGMWQSPEAHFVLGARATF